MSVTPAKECKKGCPCSRWRQYYRDGGAPFLWDGCFYPDVDRKIEEGHCEQGGRDYKNHKGKAVKRNQKKIRADKR